MQSQTPLGRLLLSVFVRSRHRPTDNNLKWWRSYVSEFFAPSAVLRLTDMGRSNPVHHEIPFALMPRFFQIKYNSHLREEWLFTGHCKEMRDAVGMQLGCAQALEHSVFDTYVMVKCGQLRVLFNSQMYILVYEFRVTMMENFICKQVCQHVEHELQLLTQLMEQSHHLLQGPSASPYSAAEALQHALDKVKAISDVFQRQAAAQTTYAEHLTLVAGIADAVGSMGDLLEISAHHNHSPLAALRQYGTLSAHLSQTPGLAGLPPATLHPNHAAEGTLGPPATQPPLGLPMAPGHDPGSALAAQQQQHANANGPTLAPAGSASRPLPHLDHLLMSGGPPGMGNAGPPGMGGGGGGAPGGIPQRPPTHQGMAMSPPLMVPPSPNLPPSAASSPVVPLGSQPLQPSSSATGGQPYVDRGRLMQAVYSPQPLAPQQGGGNEGSN